LVFGTGAFQVKNEIPSDRSIANTLGAAYEVWAAILESLQANYDAIVSEWKVSKSDCGWMRVLKQKTRTVVYLTPEDGAVRVAIVLGERAATKALTSELPDSFKELISEARPYAEGRGIRIQVRSITEVPIIMSLIALKMAK
jgi:hypothetical protein